MKVQVIQGDIASVEADALITAINSGGMWFGGIDGVIQRNAGKLFHQQAFQALPLNHGDTIVATSNGSKINAKFKNVVFVIDDLQGPLREIVANGLKSASKAGFRHVTLPTIRMGVMLGQVEKNVQEAVKEMVEGVNCFRSENPDSQLETVRSSSMSTPTPKKLFGRHSTEHIVWATSPSKHRLLVSAVLSY